MSGAATDTQRPARLAPPFARRMWPLALLAGGVFGIALPATYQTLAFRERSREAALWAGDVARRVEGLARERPVLWAYDQAQLRAVTAEVLAAPLSARVRIDAQRDAMFIAGHELPRGVEATAWALVRAEGRPVGRVEVRLPAEHIAASAARLWLGALAGGALLAAALFYLPLRTVRRGDARDEALWRDLQDANATLEARVAARTAELSVREAELSALGAQLVAVQEEERARISRDLHDDLGQVLTGLRLRLSALGHALGDAHPGQVHLAAAVDAVDEGVEQVRHLAHRLRPAALDGLGPMAALRGHAERWAEMAGVAVVLDLCAEAVPSGVGEVFFRVAQEALTNVARHAAAHHVRLSVGPFDDGWRLVVEDDGVGVLRPPTGRHGLGLVGARERIERAGGYLDLEVVAPHGTRLVAWHP